MIVLIVLLAFVGAFILMFISSVLLHLMFRKISGLSKEEYNKGPIDYWWG